MVQYIGVHNKIVLDYRFMGSKYCYSNDKEEEISVIYENFLCIERYDISLHQLLIRIFWFFISFKNIQHSKQPLM